MTRSELTMKIAKLAHECWCRQMMEDGWTAGDRFDPVAKIHDALRPFEALAPFDRDCAAMGVECDELQQRLAESVRFSRGPDREFTAGEMRVGLPVRGAEAKDPGQATAFGQVQSWEVEDPQTGRLRYIRVQWGGATTDHPACERELARVDEGS